MSDVVGIGIDIVEIERIKAAASKNPRFLERIFTERERDYFEHKKFSPATMAGNFAAKEAVVKALGTGIRDVSFAEIEILRDAFGKPIVTLGGRLESICQAKGIGDIQISISHSKYYAVANAIATNRGD